MTESQEESDGGGGLPTAAMLCKRIEYPGLDKEYSVNDVVRLVDKNTTIEGINDSVSYKIEENGELVRRKDIKDRVKGLKQFFEDRRQKYFDEGNHVVNPQAVNELEKARNKVEELLEEVEQ